VKALGKVEVELYSFITLTLYGGW